MTRLIELAFSEDKVKRDSRGRFASGAGGASAMAGKTGWNDEWEMGQQVRVRGAVYHAARLSTALKIADDGVLGADGTPARVTTDPGNLGGDVQWDALVKMDGSKLPMMTVQAAKDSIYRSENELYHPGKIKIRGAVLGVYVNPDSLPYLNYSAGRIRALEAKGIPVYVGLDGGQRAIHLLGG